MLRSRELVSFSGKCPLDCKHCFTKEIENDEPENGVDDVIKVLAGKKFDVVYVSHYKENFFNPQKGVQLCEEIYNTYKCDICVTTRCTLSGEPIARIKKLNELMKENGHNLTFCISVPAFDSYSKIENGLLIPSPSQRIDFAGQLKSLGITSLITIRPLFPSSFISTEEIHTIVDKCEGKIDGILTGGICVSDRILKDLGVSKDAFNYHEESQSEYLVGIEKAFYSVNVDAEMQNLELYCATKGIPFFRHSMDALNFFQERL